MPPALANRHAAPQHTLGARGALYPYSPGWLRQKEGARSAFRTVITGITISDVWLWVKWFFLLPGDGLIAAILAFPELAQFLELTDLAYGGWPLRAVHGDRWRAIVIFTVRRK